MTQQEILLICWNLLFLTVSNGLLRFTVLYARSKPPGRKLVGNIEIFQYCLDQRLVISITGKSSLVENSKETKLFSPFLYQAATEVQSIGMFVLSSIITILPLASIVKFIIGNFNFYSIFVVVEVLKIMFSLGTS